MLSLVNWVTLGKQLDLCVPHFSHVQNGAVHPWRPAVGSPGLVHGMHVLVWHLVHVSLSAHQLDVVII